MKNLFKECKPFKLLIIGALLTIAMGSLADLWMPNLMSKIVNYGVLKGDIAYITRTGALMVLVATVSVACFLATGFLSSRFSAGLSKNLRNKVFEKITSFSLAEFDHFGTASLITRTTNDIAQINNFAAVILRIVVMAPFMSIGGCIMAYSKSPLLARPFFFALLLMFGLVIAIAKMTVPLSKIMQKKIDAVNLVMREKLNGVRVIRAFGTDEYERKRFDRANKDLTNNAINMQRTVGLVMPVLMLSMNGTSIAIVWLGGLQASYGGIMVGDIMALTQYVGMVLMSTMMLSNVFMMLPRASASAERINQILLTNPTIADDEKTTTPEKSEGVIEFRNVTFYYPGAELPALNNISFKAKKGETTAIVGSTGSGKTTLINLIPRFYDVDQGSILLDGIDVRRYSQKTLRARIGYVPQKATLFTGTVEENIRFGRETASDEEVIAAAEMSQSTDFIGNNADGFEHLISQGGVNLSGGQKQRLSIARAVVRRPDVYLFDDSFSALDFQTDAKLRKALSEQVGSATVFIVAQRVSTIMNADRIIVLEGGSVVGIGNHKQLMKDCPVYREIVLSQLSAEEADHE